MSPTTVLAIVTVCALAGGIQALTGFGYALVSTPLLATTIGPKESVVLSVILGSLTAITMSYRYRGTVDRAVATRMVIGRVVGMPFGIVVLVLVSEDTLQLAIAASVVAATYMIWRGVRLEGTGATADVGAGLLSGVLTTSVSTGGPPLVLAMQARGMAPDRFRGTMSMITVVTSAIAIGMLFGADRITRDVVDAGLVGLPGMLVGMWGGRVVAPRVSAHRFGQLVLLLLVVAALIAAASAVLG